MSKVDTAITRFKNGLSCSQAVFSTYAEEHGVSFETACRIAGGLGGGIGRTGKTCGAITGAIMAIGLLLKEQNPTEKQFKEKVYPHARALLEKFAARHGSTNCNDLVGVDMSTPEGFAKAVQENIIKTRCPEFVRTCAEFLETLREQQQ